jgi:hypothetical protein
MHILIYGNCQGGSVYRYLQKYTTKFTLDYMVNYEYIFKQLPLPGDLISRCDIFIYQPIEETRGIYSTKHIMTLLKPTCRCISFPYLFFYGYAPDEHDYSKKEATISSTCLFGNWPYDNHKILELLSRDGKLTGSEISEQIQRDDFISKEFLMEKTSYSITTLRRHESNCTVQVADFIEREYRKHLLFYTRNHPTNVLLDEVFRQLCAQLEIPHVSIRNDKPYLDATVSLIYPCVHKYLTLEFPIPLPRFNNKTYTLDAFIDEYIKILRTPV